MGTPLNRAGVEDKSNVLGQVLARRERVAARLAAVGRVVAVTPAPAGSGQV